MAPRPLTPDGIAAVLRPERWTRGRWMEPGR